MDKEIAEKTVGILSCLEKRNIELDIEEVGKRKINLYYGGSFFPVILVHDNYASVRFYN